MLKRRYHGSECPSRFFAHNIIGILFIISLICFSSSTIAGIPAGKDVYIYNVDVGKFSVLWQVNVPSTCTIMVYNDINGLNEVQVYTPVSNTNASALAQARGLMQVDIKDLPPESTTYYFQTVSTDKNSGEIYAWPEPGSLLSVKTEPFIPDPPPNNGLLELMLYDPNGIDPENPLENLIADGIVALVDTAGNYPVSSDTSGWPQIQSGNHYSVIIDLSKLRSGNGYFDLISENTDHTITVMCFGGLVSGTGLGQRIIQTIYPEDLIQFSIDHSWYPCLSEFDIHDLDGCGFDSGNQIILEISQTSADADEDGHNAIIYEGDDCNDNDSTIYPNGPEICDGKDNNCNGKVDPDEKKPIVNDTQNWGLHMIYAGFLSGSIGNNYYNPISIPTFTGLSGGIYPTLIGIPTFSDFNVKNYPGYVWTPTFSGFPNFSWLLNFNIMNSFADIGGLPYFINLYTPYLFQPESIDQTPQQFFLFQ